jgi:thiol-disulfide isomerase/thioredoxin
MIVLHIETEKDAFMVDKLINQGSDVFILVYMKGCGPCNATRPEWEKLEPTLKSQYAKNNKLVVIDINKDYIDKVKHIGSIDGFPTMKYISNYGKKVEPYEKSSIGRKDRSLDSFVNWIETNINSVHSVTPNSSAYDRIVGKSNTRRKRKNTKRRSTKRRNTRRVSKRH